MESLMKSIADMNIMFNNRMAEFEARDRQQNDASTATTSLEAEFKNFKKFVLQALSVVQQQVQMLAHSADNMEIRSRRKMLLFHGVAEEKNEDTDLLISKLVTEKLQISGLTTSDIKRSQRMGRTSSTSKPRPILIKFQQVATRDAVWFTKTKLKGTGVTVSEFLTKSRHDLFMSARDKLGIGRCWTLQGNVFVMGPGDRRQRVSSLMELATIVEEPVKPVAEAKIGATKPRRAAKK